MDGPGGRWEGSLQSLLGWRQPKRLAPSRGPNSDEWQAMVANKSDDMTVLPVRQYRVFLSLLLFVYFRNFLHFGAVAFSHFRIFAFWPFGQ